jgi:F420-0:gamma-glutamyl ligase
MVREGDNLAKLIIRAHAAMGLKLEHGDILIVCQKIVSTPLAVCVRRRRA